MILKKKFFFKFNIFVLLFRRRIRDKYETELREVEKTERETTERYNTIKAKYNELEGEHERLKVVIRQKDKELEDIHRVG